MMIRIRNKNGTVEELSPENRFIELCDDDGNIGCAVFMTDQGTLRIIYPEDIKDVAQYTNAFNVTFCKKTVSVKQSVHDHRSTHQR